MSIKGIITAKSLTINDYTLRLEPADGGVQLSIIRGNEIQTEFIPDGLSPEFGVETVEGGHKLTVTDAAGTREYFLPDAALPEGGEPGQILTRTEGGGAGWQNPPKGFSGDYNDLENRPVSADVKKINIEWDGVVPADADSFEIGTSGIMYYKFSDEVPDIERIVSAYAETSTGKTGGDILQGGNCYQITPSSVAAVLVVTEAGACTRPKGDSFTAPSTGVYLYHVSAQHTTKCQIEYEDVQQLDEKFIPGSIARVDDIPEAVKTVNGTAPDETGNVEVSAMPAADGAFKQLVTGADGAAKWEDRTHYSHEAAKTVEGKMACSPNNMADMLLNPALVIQPGVEYFVSIATVGDFTCVASELLPGLAGFGNSELFGVPFPTGNNEPFFFFLDAGAVRAITTLDGMFDITISYSMFETVTIPAEYLPRGSEFGYGVYNALGIQDAVRAPNLKPIVGTTTYDEARKQSNFPVHGNLYYEKDWHKIVNTWASAYSGDGVTYTGTVTYLCLSSKGQLFEIFGTFDGADDDSLLASLEVTYPTNMILNSSTSGSTKKFKITVDDSGTLTATEIT